MGGLVVPFKRRDLAQCPKAETLRPKFTRLVDRMQVLMLENPAAGRLSLAWMAWFLDRLSTFLDHHGV